MARSWLSELKEPVIFNQLHNVTGLPDLGTAYPSRNITNWAMFKRDPTAGEYLFDEGHDEATMQRVLPRLFRNYHRALYTLNVEHWYLNRSFEEALRGMKEHFLICEKATRILYRAANGLAEDDGVVFDDARYEFPLGFYRQYPTREYKEYLNPEFVKRWALRNDTTMKNIQSVLGFLAPSLYYIDSRVSDFEQWKTFAASQLIEARRLGDVYRLPVVSWLSPRVYNFKNKPLKDYDLFKSILEWTLDQGSHVIVYDTSNEWAWEGGYLALVDVLRERYGAIIRKPVGVAGGVDDIDEGCED